MAYTDREIERVVQDQLSWDGRLGNSKIEVAVEAGRVILKGEVSSFAARQVAEADALMVPGVREVDNQTTIVYPAGVKKPEKRELKASILNRFLWNPNIPASEIDVDVFDGNVTLRGTVDGYWKKIRAQEIVYRMRGVVKVKNELAVVPSKEYSDKEVAQSIIAAMERSEYIDSQRIELQVERGVVSVAGKLDGRNQIQEVLRIVKFTKGVRDLVNLLDEGYKAA